MKCECYRCLEWPDERDFAAWGHRGAIAMHAQYNGQFAAIARRAFMERFRSPEEKSLYFRKLAARKGSFLRLTGMRCRYGHLPPHEHWRRCRPCQRIANRALVDLQTSLAFVRQFVDHFDNVTRIFKGVNP